MFYLYTEIFHYNQLCRLDPVFATGLKKSLDELAAKQGGQIIEDYQFLYRFPSLFEETTARIVEGIFRIHESLSEIEDRLPGFSLLVLSVDDSDSDFDKRLQYLRYQTLEENRIWIDKRCRKIFSPYADYEETDATNPLVLVSGQKRHLPFLVDRLSRLKERPVVRDAMKKLLLDMENDSSDSSVIVIRTFTGTEAEFNIKGVLSQQTSPERIFVMAPSRHSLDTTGPFLSMLDPDKLKRLIEKFEGKEEEASFQFLLRCLSRRTDDLCRDRFIDDFREALVVYLKKSLPDKKSAGQGLFVLARGAETYPDKTMEILSGIMGEIQGLPVRFIIITVDHDFIPDRNFGEYRSLTIGPMDNNEIKDNLNDLIADLKLPEDLVTEHMVDYSRGYPVLLFHYLFFIQNREVEHIGKDLVCDLDYISRLLFLLVARTSGMLNRKNYINYLNVVDPSDAAIEERFSRMIQLGLLDELENGLTVTVYPALLDRMPDMGNLDEASELEKFALYLYHIWLKGEGIITLDLFLFIEEQGPVLCGLEILSQLTRSRLNSADHEGLRALLDRPFYSGRKLPAAEFSALQNILKTARLRDSLLEGKAVRISQLVTGHSDLLVASAGLYSDYYRLQQGHYYYTQGDPDKSLSYIKEALFSFQKNGDHYGEAVSNIDLGLCLLHSGKVRPALEYFEIARRISYQIGDAYSQVRSSSLEALSHFVYGNIPRAGRVLEGVLPLTEKECRRDWNLFLRFLEGRIAFELGDYEKAVELFKSGSEFAQLSGYNGKAIRLKSWQARSLTYNGRYTQSENLLNKLPESRETVFFLAEASYLRGNFKTAIELSEKSDSLNMTPGTKDPKREVMGERNLWSDGYSLIEGRLGLSHNHGDTLYCLNNALRFYMWGLLDDFTRAEEGFENMFRSEQSRNYKPYNYLLYFLYSMIILKKSGKSMETHLKILSKAVSELQSYAGRFDDQQVKRAFLTRNYWCGQIMEEAKKRKFI